MKFSLAFVIEFVFLFTCVNGQFSQLTFSITNEAPPGDPIDPIPDADSGNIGKYFYSKVGAGINITAMFDVQGTPEQEVLVNWYFNEELIMFGTELLSNLPPGANFFTTRESVNIFEASMRVLADSDTVRRTSTLYVPNIDPIHAGIFTFEVSSGDIRARASSLLILLPEGQGPSCTLDPVDVCFVIDGSGSLSQVQFDQERDFVVNIAKQAASPSSRFCYSIFSSSVVSQFPLSFDRDQFETSLLAETFPRGTTDLLVALSHADSFLLTNENRLDARRRILFFLTDGADSSSVDSLRSVSSSLSRKKVETVAIGFGDNINMNQLMAIGLTQNFVFNNYDEAQQKIGNITSFICRDRPQCCLGPDGRRGPVGPKGLLGAVGDDGIPGICVTLEDCFGYSSTSSKGNVGPIGSKGRPGVDGPSGSAGRKGEVGDVGGKGSQGTTGGKGDKGDQGTIGPKGSTGGLGEKGMDGETGVEGERGQNGQNGAKGLPGPVGVCRSDSCKGTKGSRGVSGASGAIGIPGAKGIAGSVGQKGSRGQKGMEGMDGEAGTRGAKGSSGEAIEKRDFVDEACSPSGSLFFDQSTKKLYYCERGRYLCVSSNGTCDGAVECICTRQGIPCGQFTRNADREACGRNVAVDFILVVDDTSSMDRQQNWLRRYLPELENALTARCIGNQTGIPNRYQIIAYGAKDIIPGLFARKPHFVIEGDGLESYYSPPIPDPTFTIDKLEEVTGNLQNIGGFGLAGDEELGYEALEFALNYSVLRENTESITYIPILILLTNGDADDFSESGYNVLLEMIKRRPSMVLAFAINFGNFTTNPSLRIPFGVANDYERGNLGVWHIPNANSDATLQNVAYGSATSDVSIAVTPNSEYRNVGRDFLNFIMCSMRSSASAWDLDFVVNGDDQDVRRFTDAFIQQNSDSIINRAQQFSCTFCFCSPSATEVCAIIENENICSCLQDDPSSECNCVQSSLQALVQQATQSFSPTVTQLDNIVATCGLLPPTIPPSNVPCTSYVNYIN